MEYHKLSAFCQTKNAKTATICEHTLFFRMSAQKINASTQHETAHCDESTHLLQTPKTPENKIIDSEKFFVAHKRDLDAQFGPCGSENERELVKNVKLDFSKYTPISGSRYIDKCVSTETTVRPAAKRAKKRSLQPHDTPIRKSGTRKNCAVLESKSRTKKSPKLATNTKLLLTSSLVSGILGYYTSH